MSVFDSVLFFFNTDFTHLTPFYIRKSYKIRKNGGIYKVFIKNNIRIAESTFIFRYLTYSVIPAIQVDISQRQFGFPIGRASF